MLKLLKRFFALPRNGLKAGEVVRLRDGYVLVTDPCPGGPFRSAIAGVPCDVWGNRTSDGERIFTIYDVAAK
jgi:hypothetical protein